MARYFFGNTLAACSRSSTAVIEDTAAGTFDPAFVSNCLKVPTAADFVQTMPFIDASSVTDLYLRFDLYESWNFNVASILLQFLDSLGTVVARVIPAGTGSTSALTFQYWNGSSFVTYLTTNASLAISTLYTIAMHVTCGASGTCDIWFGSTRVMTASGAMNAAFDNIAAVRFMAAGDAGISVGHFSQILGADHDLRDTKYLCQLATGEGHYTDGTGAYTDINEVQLDDSTNIVLPASTNKHTFVHTAITVPQGYAIAAATVGARGRVSGGTITDGKLMFRSGTTDSLSTGRAYNSGYEPRGFYLDNDPSTVSPWTQTGYNAAEFGAAAP